MTTYNYYKLDSFVHEKLVDKDGYMNPQWVNFFTQLFYNIQASIGAVGPEGLVPPSLTPAQMTVVQTNGGNGTIVYDSTNNKLNVRLSDGTFHTITTS